QKKYWDNVAAGYDKHYSDRWSQHENKLVEQRLSNLLTFCPTRPRIVEFGCGTGLGYQLLTKALSTELDYTGIDVSPAMLSVFKTKPRAEAGLINSALELLPPDSFSNVDLVMAIFTSASYVDMGLDQLLDRLCGWLKPEAGILYLSFL